ncbi:MAG: zinc ribbon domain-containing protein [Clostridia bacterium]|nr:zinc ribbon domain-containing protein [Clostridia bacterium]
MDVITSIKETLGKAIKTGVDKSNEIVEITKLKFALSDIESDISKLMRDIGESVYEAYKENKEPDEEINANCALIAEKYEQAEEMRAKINELKKLTQCPKCGCAMDKDAQFCSKCGEKLA